MVWTVPYMGKIWNSILWNFGSIGSSISFFPCRPSWELISAEHQSCLQYSFSVSHHVYIDDLSSLFQGSLVGVGCCHLLAKSAQQENKCTTDDAFQSKDIGSYIVPSSNISESRELLHDLLLGPTCPGAGMLCSRIGILCSMLSCLARQHQSTCGYQAQYQAQQE